MKLSTRSRYGLRIILEIAKNYGKRVTSVKEIATSQKISRKYVEQILIKLKKNNIIKSERGIKGGYTLTREPSQIKVGEIKEILENGIRIVDCKKCDIFKQCLTKDIWKEAESILKNYFYNIPLDKILNGKGLKQF